MAAAVEPRDACFLRRRCTVLGVEQCLPLQQDAGDSEQPVGDTAQGAAVRVTASAQDIVAAAARGIFLNGRAGPVSAG